MIDLKDVYIYYGRKEVIRGISARVDGEKVLLMGPNGSGKTTLLSAIAGIVPYKGSIRVDGMEVRGVKNYNAVATNLPQAFSLGLTVEDVIEVYEEVKGCKADVRRELEKLGIKLNKAVYQLSAGQGVLVRTLIALATDPKVVLIDEPFENVDVSKRKVVVSWLKEYGKEGVIVTHEVDIARLFSDYNCFLIFEGSLFGPIKAGDLLSSSIVFGEDPSALLTLTVNGKKISLIRGDKGYRVDSMSNLERLYDLVAEA
ncbi:ATP-binding cassette domain-containing protein [Stygiolobus caldivivus]|uniref:Mn2+/Zn2+ABC transporter ATP-binding protein n=1 Tax=Stygiolobus caldivivus TaxID=2824673 RepID=A0A8D5ZIW3_9CREN|nr:ATP-binding cassette domain-containing protein [Stygiolobus caldivivus]BCU69632.1 Mn2+/Zn2+ABC transporter ATP-binding protein [Stygiolobus caldivivus]